MKARPKKARSKTIATRIDWAAAQAEYVNNPTLNYSDVAKKYGVHEVNLRHRAAREGWTGLREARAALVVQKATARSVTNVVEELARYNEQDLAIAKALRAVAARQMQNTTLGPRDVRALAGTVAEAQKIARLALGASTENTDMRVSKGDQMTPEERRERIRQLHAELFPTVQ